MPNITIISAVYPPEPVVSARMSLDLAKLLAAQGNRVTVICPQPSRPLGTEYNTYSASDKISVSHEGNIEVVRLPSFTSPQLKLFSRMRESWSFGKSCCHYLSRLAVAPEVLYVNAWPLLGQALIARYAKQNRIPMVLQIMDIYPESLLNRLPGLVRSLIGSPLRMLDGWTARQASSICVISESMRRIYLTHRRIPEERIVTIPTWQDEKMFIAPIDREVACASYSVRPDRFTFLYLGNIGPIAGVDFLIQAFHNAMIESAQLLIVGDGSAKEACKKLVKELKAANIYFISDPDARNVPLLQSMANVCLLPLKRGAGSSSIPSKLPAYLFSAKPVLATVDEDSDTANVIREGACGWVGPPEDHEWLSAKMKVVAAMKMDELCTLGENGRGYALPLFSKAQGVKRLSELVTSSAGYFRSMP